MINRKSLSILIFITLLVSVLNNCAINPATGGANFVLMTEKEEKKLGLEQHEKLTNSLLIYKDEELQEYVEKIGKSLVEVSHRPELEYTFTIIDSQDINAFASPGGFIYVNRGLLAFLNSEGELAAVLAHELGHITARHGIRSEAQKSIAKAVTKVGGVATAVATRSNSLGNQVANISSVMSATAISGFGREMELEADRLGAEYMSDAGYDPSSMLNIFTTFKNREDFLRRTTGARIGHHGLFATHPRNDKRLQQTIDDVARLSGGEVTRSDDAEFRAHLEGLVVGQSNQSQRTDERNRYYQNLLGYTLVFPPEWTVEETTTTATGQLAGRGQLHIEAQRLQDNLDPRLFIRDRLGIDSLQRSEPLEQFRLVGHTGVATSAETGMDERIAVIYLGRRAFIFRGSSLDAGSADEVDAELLAAIRSFRAIQRGEGAGVEAKIRFVQASEYFDFSVVAQQSRLSSYPEETLRLLNNYYPNGTPAPGEWIKLVE
jgi:predicted Zn-dependent protease